MAHRSESRGGICHNTCEIIFICLSGKHAHPQLYLRRDHGRVVGPRPVCAGRHHGLQPAGINNMEMSASGQELTSRLASDLVRLVP